MLLWAGRGLANDLEGGHGGVDPEGLHGPADVDAHGRRPAAEDPGDLVVAEVLEVAQDERGSLPGRQPGELPQDRVAAVDRSGRVAHRPVQLTVGPDLDPAP